MNTVLRVDLEALPLGVLDNFIHARRAVTLRRFIVNRQVALQRDGRVQQGEVTGLVFLVVGVGQEYRGQPVEADLVVGLGVFDLLALGRGLHGRVVGLAVIQGEGQAATENVLVYPDHGGAQQDAELVHEAGEVAGGVQLLVEPGGLELFLVGHQVRRRGIAQGQGLDHGLRRQHAALHGSVVTLDLDAVEGAGVATDQQAAGEVHARQGVQAALGDRPGAVSDAGTALYIFQGLRVMLPALELLEGAHVGVAVVQVRDQPQVDLVVFRVVQKRAAAGAGLVQGPAQSVYHQALIVFFRRDFPYFLDADAVVLRVLLRIQGELADQLLAQVAATALGKQRVTGMQFHTGHVAVLVLAAGAHPHIAGGHALYPAIFMVQHLGGGEPRVDLYPQALCLLSQPAADVAHGDNVIALVVGGLGYKKVGQFYGAALAEVEEKLVAFDLGVERGAELLPVGEQFFQGVWLQHGAGEGMGAHLGTFFHHAYSDFLLFFLCQLHDAAGGRQARGARANDHYIKFH